MYQNQQQQSPSKYGACYRCNSPGHWANNCPEKWANRSPIKPAQPKPTSGPELPATHCPCGAGICHVLVSGSVKNPGRKYYRCPGLKWNNCGYFKFCDQLRVEQILEAPPNSSFPECRCGAGTCSIKVENYGPNAGRRYFACRVEKGEGACNFRQWLDASVQPELLVSGDVDAEQNPLEDDFHLTQEQEMIIDALGMRRHKDPPEALQKQTEDGEDNMASEIADEASPECYEVDPSSVMNNLSGKEVPIAMDTSTHKKTLGDVQFEMADGDEEETSDGAGDTSAVPSAFHPPTLNDSSEDISDTTFDNRYPLMLQNRVGDCALENTHESSMAVVAALRNSTSQDMLKNLMAYLLQETSWLEGFAYTSQYIIISALATFFSGLKDSPGEGFSPGLGDQPGDGLLLDSLRLSKDDLEAGSIMKGTILEAFEEFACRFKNDLITLLESMGPQKHETMLREAKCTFAGLDRLQVDYGLFRLRVTEYINQASVLDRIEQKIRDDVSSQEILDRYNEEKSRYDEVSKAYSQAKLAFMASNKQLCALREKAYCLKNLLFEMENELSCCESENAAQREKLLQITKTMSERRESFQAAALEAEEVFKQSERREIELTAAKAAFEKARAQLRK